jgi:non-specific serine/threonine protein kinase
VQLENALAIVGDNALLYAGLGSVYIHYAHAGIRMDEGTYLKSEEFAANALRLDPDLAQGHALLASIAQARGSLRQAFRHAQQALKINPSEPDALFYLLSTAFFLGKLSLLQEFADRYIRIDPLSYLPHGCLANRLISEGRYLEALHHLRTAYRLDPDSYLARFWLYMGLAANRLFDEAQALLLPWAKEAPGSVMPMSAAFIMYSARGNKEQALATVADKWIAAAWQDYYLPLTMAEGYALLGETAEALRWLEHAVDKGWINYPFLYEVDPWLQSLRSDTRFEQLMQRVKREWEAFDI